MCIFLQKLSFYEASSLIHAACVQEGKTCAHFSAPHNKHQPKIKDR